jgi:hypothetical protein
VALVTSLFLVRRIVGQILHDDGAVSTRRIEAREAHHGADGSRRSEQLLLAVTHPSVARIGVETGCRAGSLRSAPRQLAQLVATVRINAQIDGASLTNLSIPAAAATRRPPWRRVFGRSTF